MGLSPGEKQREQGREGKKKQLFSVFLLLPQQLTCVFPRSVIFSAAVITFRHAFFKDTFAGSFWLHLIAAEILDRCEGTERGE